VNDAQRVAADAGGAAKSDAHLAFDVVGFVVARAKRGPVVTASVVGGRPGASDNRWRDPGQRFDRCSRTSVAAGRRHYGATPTRRRSDAVVAGCDLPAEARPDHHLFPPPVKRGGQGVRRVSMLSFPAAEIQGTMGPSPTAC